MRYTAKGVGFVPPWLDGDSGKEMSKGLPAKGGPTLAFHPGFPSQIGERFGQEVLQSQPVLD